MTEPVNCAARRAIPPVLRDPVQTPPGKGMARYTAARKGMEAVSATAGSTAHGA